MYCHICGTNNSSNSIYCSNDGIELINNRADSQITLIKEHKFCPECGCNTNQQTNYCNDCGVGLHKGEYQQLELSPNAILGTNKGSLSNYLPSNFTMILKKSIFGSLISIICVLLISLVISMAASKQLNDSLSKLPYVHGMFDKAQLKIIGVPETLLISNLISSKMTLTVGKELASGNIEIHLGLIALLIIPFICLSIGGFLSARKHNVRNAIESLHISFGAGIIYAVFLILMSLFGGFSHSVDNPIGKGSFEISFGFSLFGAMFNGVVLGTFFSWLGSLMYLKWTKIEKHSDMNLNLDEAIQQGIFTALRGIGICSLYLLIVVLIKNNNDDMPFWAVLLLVPQLGAYLWNVVNFNPFSIAAEGETMKVSIFSGIEMPGGNSDEFNVYVYLGLIVTIALFIWAGKKIIAISRTNTLQNTLLFSTAYALIMTFIVITSNLTVKMQGKIPFMDLNNSPVIDGGFGIIATFFSCFVTSFILTYISTIGFRNIPSNVNHNI